MNTIKKRLEELRPLIEQVRIVNINNYAALDIFPVDSYYQTNLSEEDKLNITENIRKAREIFDLKYPKKELYYNVDVMINELNKCKNKYIMHNRQPYSEGALYYGIDFPYQSANNLIYNYNEIFPLNKVLFEGEYYSAPNLTHEYLINVYNDYNKFPEYICAANPQYFEKLKQSLPIHEN